MNGCRQKDRIFSFPGRFQYLVSIDVSAAKKPQRPWKSTARILLLLRSRSRTGTDVTATKPQSSKIVPDEVSNH